MGQTIDSSKKSVGELLGTSERRPVVLPEFQRSYSWEKSQVAEFWGDLSSFVPKFKKSPIDASYFLGPIVILDDSKKIIVLDGQQRLATSTILLSRMRDIARSLGAQEGQDFARDLQRDVIEKSKAPLTYSLTLGDLDEPFFRASIKSDPPESTKPTLRSHQLIQSAAEYFANQLQLLVNGLAVKDALEILNEFQNVVTKAMTLVAITVKDEEDAYDIFESLNDRGLRLSVPDLVVNLLLRRCPDNQSRVTVRQKWNVVVQEVGKRDVSRFLRHLWISQFGDLKARGLYSEIKGHLTEKKITSLNFAEKCAEEADTYIGIVEKTVGLSKQAKRNIEGLLDHLGVNNSLPLLLSGYLCLSESDFEKLLKATVSIYVRHSLVANQNPLELETAYYDAAREIRAQHNSKVVSGKCLSAAKIILQKLNPSDAIVEQKAANLSLSRSEASWFMAEIASNIQSQTKEITMDKANVEHIFPQNAGTEWPERDRLEPYIWHIGNLTILGKGINNKAGNKAYADKCTDNYSKSEIAMSKELGKTYKTWDVDAIKRRGAELAKLAVKIWK